MTGQATTLVVAAAMAGATVLGGPLSQVFSELTGIMAIMGAAGGMTWGLANRRGWKETTRGFFVGGLMAAGFGAVAPHIVTWLSGIEFGPGEQNVQALASCAFFLGLAQDWVVAKLRKALG